VNLFIRNSDGERSATCTILVLGSGICFIKLLVSEMTLLDMFTFPKFGGAEFAIAIAALGTLYQSTKVIDKKYKNEMVRLNEKNNPKEFD